MTKEELERRFPVGQLSGNAEGLAQFCTGVYEYARTRTLRQVVAELRNLQSVYRPDTGGFAIPIEDILVYVAGLEKLLK